MASPNDPTGTGPQGPAHDAGPPRQGLWALVERRLLLNVATGLALMATGIMLMESISRSTLSHSYFWAEESVRYLMIWAFFLTLGAAGRAGHMIRTEMLVERLFPRMRQAANIVTTALGVLFSGVLLYASIPQVLRYRSMGMLTESNLDLPMWLLFLAMPLGAILMGSYYLGALREALSGRDPYRLVDADPELPSDMKGPLL